MKKAVLIIIGVGFAGVVFSQSLVELQWNKSFGTLKFSTTSGWIESGQYALNEKGDGYYVCLRNETCGVDVPLWEKDLEYDISGLTQVFVLGFTYFNDFTDTDGSRVREEVTKEQYNTYKTEKPVKTKVRVANAFGQEQHPRHSTTTASGQVNTNTITFNANADGTILIVGSTSSDADGNDLDVSSATYNGVNLSLIAGCEGVSIDWFRAEQWYLTNPASGSNSVVVNYTGVTTVSSAFATGVKGGSINFDTSKADCITETQINVSNKINSDYKDTSLYVDTIEVKNDCTETLTSSQVINRTQCFADGNNAGQSIKEILFAAGEPTMDWTNSSNSAIAHIITAVQPTSTPAGLMLFNSGVSIENGELGLDKWH